MKATSLYHERVCHLLTLLLLAAALALLIVGVSLHNLFKVDASDVTEGPATQMQGSITSGAFSGCFAFTGVYELSPFSINHCYAISSSCSVTAHIQTAQGTFDETDTFPHCPQFNAFRAFAIIGIVLLGPAMLLAALSLRLYSTQRALKWTAVGLLTGAILSIVISWACVANLITKVDPNGIVKRGPAFAVSVTAWVLMVVALPLFLLSKYMDEADGGYSKDAATGSFRKQMDTSDTNGDAGATEMTYPTKGEETPAA